MRKTHSRYSSRVAAAVIALAFMAQAPAVASTEARIERAWQEAVALSGRPTLTLSQPEVIFWRAVSSRSDHVAAEYIPYINEIHVYDSGRVPAHQLLVHEFLHAIYHQMHADNLSLAALAQGDPSESWVQARVHTAQRR